ncbi:MAG: ATP-dependent metallopeptidase FtsH/Yme1/Tma family protein, partial [Chloroflexi bacterium]|nr:ATP-dependent metallopeptidase FtsH/Yme1/Tma family protein [Chloroflexota bacterium]
MPATSPPPPNPFLRTDRQQQGQTPARGPNRFGLGWGWLIAFIVILVLNVILENVLSSSGAGRITIPYTEFVAQVKGNNVQTVTATGDVIDGHVGTAITAPGGGTRSQDFETIVPTFVNANINGGATGSGSDLETLLEQHGVQVTAQEQSQSTLL